MIESTLARSYFPLGAALLLSVVPLPQALGLWQPPWLAVAFIWLALAAPQDARLVVAAGAGLLQDLLVGAPLGLHALAATFLAFLAVNLRHWIVSSPPWLRFLLAMVMVTAYLAVVALIGGWFAHPGSWEGMASSVTSGAILILVAFLFLRV